MEQTGSSSYISNALLHLSNLVVSNSDSAACSDEIEEGFILIPAKKKEFELHTLIKDPLTTTGIYYKTCTVTTRCGKFYNLTPQKVYQKVIINSDHPFNKELQKLIEDKRGSCETMMENLEEPFHLLSVPCTYAIDNQAHYYFKKYGIVIRLVQTENIEQLLIKFNKKITSPLYLGVIAAPYNLKRAATRFSHVIPLLLYFSGNHRINEIECISLDSIPSLEMLSIQEQLKKIGIPSSHIYLSKNSRQVDQYSCHTDALVVLRNALLSLKHHQYKDGFKTALQAGKLDDNTLIFLPPEWNYTSQSFHHNSLTSQFAIRSLYSKYQTVEEHRQKHSIIQKYRYTYYSIIQKYRYTYYSFFLNNITAEPPLEFNLQNEETQGSVAFTVDRTINTYLRKKDFGWKKKHRKGLKKYKQVNRLRGCKKVLNLHGSILTNY